MKIGTFTEARRSLVQRYRKNLLENRSVMIALWCQLALIVGMACLYLVILATKTPASGVVWTGFWIFIIGLPALTLALGMRGLLPGTHRKKAV